MPSGIMVSKGRAWKMALVEQQQTSGEKFPTCLFIPVNGGNQSTVR